MKKTILLVAMALGFSSSYAQLTTRENDNSVEKLGARPVAGDMGFTLSLSLGDSSAGLYGGNLLKLGNVLTYKYYLADDMVIRAGLRLKNENTATKGTVVDSSALYQYGQVLTPGSTKEIKKKTVNRMWEIVPGIEKHFSASNFFDAYVGADLYLGLGKDQTIDDRDALNGDFEHFKATTNTRSVGLGLITGMNIFIAHLPISIGLEYGWSAKWTFGGNTKVKYEDQSTSGTTVTSRDIEYVTDNATAIDDATHATTVTAKDKYSKLKSRKFSADSNQDVRVVLNIYFGK